MISDDGTEILLDTNALSAAFVRRCGKPSSLQVCSRALGTAIGFSPVRVLTVFLLNHGRPIGTDDSPHQLRKVFTEHGRRWQPTGRWRCTPRAKDCSAIHLA